MSNRIQEKLEFIVSWIFWIFEPALSRLSRNNCYVSYHLMYLTWAYNSECYNLIVTYENVMFQIQLDYPPAHSFGIKHSPFTYEYNEAVY